VSLPPDNDRDFRKRSNAWFAILLILGGPIIALICLVLFLLTVWTGGDR
jgi:hypothetical protein